MTEAPTYPSTLPTNTYAELSIALREIARCLVLADVDGGGGLVAPYVMLSILPTTADHASEEARVRTVDALARVVLGRAGSREPNGNSWSHQVRGDVGPVAVSIHTGVSAPPPDEVQAELRNLRAENARLRAEAADDDDPGVYVDIAAIRATAAAALTPDDGSEVGAEYDPREPLLPRPAAL